MCGILLYLIFIFWIIYRKIELNSYDTENDLCDIENDLIEFVFHKK